MSEWVWKHLRELNQQHNNNKNNFRIVVYIGDLSYMIYLTHWPIIILYKYYVEVQEEFSVRGASDL